MSICDEDITKNCDTCYEVSRADNDLTFNYGLTPSTQYYLWVMDKFRKVFKVLITSSVSGAFTIDPDNNAYINGMFNKYAGAFEVWLSTDVDGVNIVPVTLYATDYDCILLTITSNTEINCTVTPLPACGDAFLLNSDRSWSDNADCGEEYTVEDIDFTFKDVNDNIIGTSSTPNMVDTTIEVDFVSICKTLFNYNLYVNNVFQQVVVVDVESDINITIN